MTGSNPSRLVMAAAAVAVALALTGCEPMGPDELQREVETIHSTAAEGSGGGFSGGAAARGAAVPCVRMRSASCAAS